MVDVISAQTRAEAQRRLELARQQRQQLLSQRARLGSASALRNLSLLQRQRQTRQIGLSQTNLQQQLSELERLSRLPTPEEIPQADPREFERRARKLAVSKIPLRFVPSDLKDAVRTLREEGGLGTPQQTLIDLKAQELPSVSLQSQIARGEFQGPVPLGESEIAFRQTGKRVRLTQGPVRETESEIAFRELGKRIPLARESEFFTTEQVQQPVISKLSAADRSRIAISSAGQDVRRLGTQFREKPFQTFRSIQRQTSRELLRRLIKAPTKEEYLALLFLPAFGTGAAAQSEFQEVRSATGELLGFRKKPTKQQIDALVSDVQGFFGTRNIPQQREKVREIVLRFQNDPNKLRLAKNFIDKSIGKASSDALFQDILAQEGLTVTKTNKVIALRGIGAANIPASAPITAQVAKAREAARIADLPRMVGGGGRVRSAFTGRGAQFERAEFTSGGLVNRTRQLQREGLTPLSLEQQRQRFRLQSLQLQRNLQQQGLSNKQIQQELQRLREQQRQQVRQAALTALAQRNTLRQQQQLRQRTRQDFGRPRGGGQRFRPRLRPPFKLPPFLPDGSGLSKRRASIRQGVAAKFDVFAKKKGKLIRINKKPILGKSAARDYLAERLDRTLRASGTTRPSARSGFARIPKATTGYLKRNAQKFYTNKKTGFLVEKRKYRIEKQDRGELREIKAAKAFAPKYRPFKRL